MHQMKPQPQPHHQTHHQTQPQTQQQTQQQTQPQTQEANSAFNQLVAALEKDFPTLLSLVKLSEPLVTQLKNHTNEVAILAPTETVFKQLKPEVVQILTDPANLSLLEDILKYHVTSSSTLSKGKLGIVPVSTILTTPAQRATISNALKSSPSTMDTEEPATTEAYKFYTGTGTNTDGESTINIFDTTNASAPTTKRKVFNMPHWLNKSSPGNNWS